MKEQKNNKTKKVSWFNCLCWLIIILMSIIIIIFTIGYNNNSKEKIEELSPSQIKAFIEMGIIQVNINKSYNNQDKFTGLYGVTNKQICYIHKDIFERYYCVWQDLI